MTGVVILLDTNVVSEAMRPRPAAQVEAWLGAQDGDRLFLSAVTEAELRAGAAVLPEGRRKAALAVEIDAMIAQSFDGRVLPFDAAAARAYAAVRAARRAAGRPILPLDAQIAAIALSRGHALATRNTRDFADCGLALIDPWENP